MRSAVTVLATAVALLGLAASAAATKRYRGVEDQNQPVRLAYDKATDRLSFRIGFIAHCVGTDGEDEGEEFPGSPIVAKPPNGARVRVHPDGTFAQHFRVRANRTSDKEGGGLDELHRRLRIQVAGRLRSRGRANGTIRVRYTELRIERNYDVELRYESDCDTDLRRWRTPRFRFTGEWRPTGAMPVAVPDFILPLPDGELFAFGAKSIDRFAAPRVATYRPGRNRWRRRRSPLEMHNQPAAATLRDGRVLVAGGSRILYDRALRTAELYNPRRDRWTRVGNLTLRRQEAVAELLPDGRVLVIGGTEGHTDTTPTASAEIFDPETRSFTATAEMPFEPNVPLTAVLPSGRILCMGLDGNSARAAIFDPSTATWSSLDLPPEFGWMTTATELEDGRILVTAISFPPEGRRPVAAIFTEGVGWAGASPPPAFAQRAAALLPSGRVLVTFEEVDPGVFESQRAATYDPGTNTWGYVEPYFQPYLHTALRVAPTSKGAMVVFDGPTRYTRTEQFFD